MDDLATADSLIPGTVIDGKYEVKRVLGTGAMGAVVEAIHLLRRARVALKFMSQDMADRPGVVERFLNEGIAASRINNEHVVKVLDVSRLPNGQPYMVMEFLDGEDLDHLLTREGARGLQDIARAVHFILQVLRGLQVAHHAGIIHRDLKPANCFAIVTEEGEADFVKLVDFGISKLQEPDTTLALTREGMAMGTPLYVSPEQARDATAVDARSDLYSVATMLYELLCGHTPFQAPTLPGLFMQLAMQAPTPLSQLRKDIPQGLSDVVLKGLEKDPRDRFQTAHEMAVALAPYADARSDAVLQKLTARPASRRSAARISDKDSLGPLGSAPAVTQFSGEPVGTAPGVVSGGSSSALPGPSGKEAKKTRALLLGGSVVALALLGAGYLKFGRTHAASPRESGAASAFITREPLAAREAPASAASPSKEEAPLTTSAPPRVVPDTTARAPASAAPSAAPPPTARPPRRSRVPAQPAVPVAGAATTPPETPESTPKAPAPAKPSLNRIGLQD